MTNEPGAPSRVSVALGERSYDIVIGNGLLRDAGTWAAPLLSRPHAAIVTDSTVAALHLPTLEEALDSAGIGHRAIVLDPGEATKAFTPLAQLLDDLLDAGVERGDTILALGGGVIGDIAGFAASVLHRGVDVIQLPTTLLAQVDSAVGGKTGINTRHGKNLVGSFHQPRLVLADFGVLDTLPRRQLLSGYAETLKYGLIDDADFFAWLEANGAAVIAGDGPARRKAVATACRAKARVVAADERDRGARALLNLGHTFAHALEVETGFGASLLHGEAVAIGLAMAFDLSVRLGFCAAEDAERVRRHLAVVGLPTCPADAGLAAGEADRLFAHMGHDKKVSRGKLMLVLVRGVGQAFLSGDVEGDEVLNTLRRAMAA